MKLDDLEKLAAEAKRLNVNCPIHWKTAEQLIALCRMQNRAIKKREPNGYAYSSAEKEALAAFDSFGRE